MRQDSINEFISKLSSGAPVPGGGGAAALMGGVASALCSMVANLTTGKKKYAEYEEDIQRILKTTETLTDATLEIIEKDAVAFEPLSKAYSIPKDDPNREATLEEALKVAATAPYEIIEQMKAVAELIEELSTKGSRLAISDVGVAATACKAATESAALNIYINTKLMKNRDFAKELNDKTQAEVSAINDKCDKAYELVLAGLKN